MRAASPFPSVSILAPGRTWIEFRDLTPARIALTRARPLERMAALVRETMEKWDRAHNFR